MTTVNEQAQAALQTLTGNTGHESGLTHEWLNGEITPDGTARSEKWLTFLADYTGTINERMYQFLGDEGYTGTLSERLYQYWQAGGGGGLVIDAANNPVSIALEAWQFPDDAVKAPWRSIYNYTSSADPITGVTVSHEVDGESATGATDLNAGELVDTTIFVTAGGQTNLIPYSDLSTGWTSTRASLTPITRALGATTLRGMTVNDNNSGGLNTVQIYFTPAGVEANTWYTFSFYGEADQTSDVAVRLQQFTELGTPEIYFDLTAGVVLSDPRMFARIEEVDTGLFRCSVTFKLGADTAGLIIFRLADGVGTTVPIDGTTSVKLYAAMLEEGRYPTAVVQTTGTPTSATSETRTIELATTVASDSGNRPVYKPTNVAHALVCRDTAQFDDVFNDGFALFAHVEYDASAGPQPIFSAHRTGGILVAMRNQKIAVSNDLGTTWTEGASTLTAGSYGVFIRYDGTALSAWVKPNGGSIVKEIDAVSVNYTAAPSPEGPVCWGGSGAYNASNFEFPANGTTIEYYAGAVWPDAYPSEAEGTAMLNGTTQVASLSPFWEIDTRTGEDKSRNVVTFKHYGVPAASLFLVEGDAPTGRKANFSVLKNAANGQPVQYDAGSGAVYWGAYNTTSSPFTARLATSSDLVTWADAGAASGVPTTVVSLQVSDFVEEGGTFHLYVGDSVGVESQIDHYTSTDMATFSADAANPVFTRASNAWWTSGTAYGDGVEDFCVIKRGAGDYVAFYEANNYETAGRIAVGCATSNSLSGAWTAVEAEKFDNEAVEDGFLTVATDTFIANPSVVTDGTDVWLFAEAATFLAGVQGPTTYAYKAPIEACTSRGAWEYLGIVTYDADDKCFSNDATIEGGVIQLYCQAGPTKVANAADGVRKVPFNPGGIYTTQALTTPA